MRLNKDTIERNKKPLIITGLMMPILSMLYLSSFTNFYWYVSRPFHIIIMVVFAIGLIITYLIPSIIGMQTKHIKSILIINLLLGWTLLGWIGALIWALNSPTIESQMETEEKQRNINNQQYDKASLSEELTRLNQLKNDGVLTQEEFEKAKKRVFDSDSNLKNKL